MRDYSRFDQYLNSLQFDIYPQPPDAGHTELAKEAIGFWMSRMPQVDTVLDVGCGQGFCRYYFEDVWKKNWKGVTLGEDYQVCQENRLNVVQMDMSFLDFHDACFDFVFSRHSLEHSPFPLLTLMEWYRVSKNWLGLVLPNPDHYQYGGLNHYSVMPDQQVRFLLDRAGWKILWDKVFDQELWYMCEKKR